MPDIMNCVTFETPSGFVLGAMSTSTNPLDTLQSFVSSASSAEVPPKEAPQILAERPIDRRPRCSPLETRQTNSRRSKPNRRRRAREGQSDTAPAFGRNDFSGLSQCVSCLATMKKHDGPIIPFTSNIRNEFEPQSLKACTLNSHNGHVGTEKLA